jgi:hypothetical protein
MPCVLDEQRLKQINALVVREDFAAAKHFLACPNFMVTLADEWRVLMSK